MMQHPESTPEIGLPVAVTVLHAFRLPACGRNAPRVDLLELSAEAGPCRVRLLARFQPGTTDTPPRVVLVPPMLRSAAAFELTAAGRAEVLA